jgi:hypothetical protein
MRAGRPRRTAPQASRRGAVVPGGGGELGPGGLGQRIGRLTAEDWEGVARAAGRLASSAQIAATSWDPCPIAIDEFPEPDSTVTDMIASFRTGNLSLSELAELFHARQWSAVPPACPSSHRCRIIGGR